MERIQPLSIVASRDPAETSLADVRAALQLVSRRLARRVVISGLAHPEAIASRGLAMAQAAGVPFRLDRDSATGTTCIVVGPLPE